MKFDDKVKKAVDTVQKGYDKAERETDGFFAKDGHTVLIFSGVAVLLVVLAVFALL